MRWVLVAILCAVLGAQEAPASRSTLSGDWFRIEFQPAQRIRALEFMAAAGPARARVRERLGVDTGAGLTIVVTADGDAMRREVVARTGREPPDWAGGLAIADLSLVLVRGDLPGERFDRVDSIVTHELVHIALAAAREPGSARMPRWFEEGLAQWIAGRARPLDVPDLRPAAMFGYLLDLSEMNAAFAGGEGAAARAYAQAESFVRFLARRSGTDAMRRIVDLVIAGVELDAAVSVATATSLPASWGLWQRELAADRGWMLGAGAQVVVAAMILLAVALGIRRVLQRKRAIEATWEREPPAGEPADATRA